MEIDLRWVPQYTRIADEMCLSHRDDIALVMRSQVPSRKASWRYFNAIKEKEWREGQVERRWRDVSGEGRDEVPTGFLWHRLGLYELLSRLR